MPKNNCMKKNVVGIYKIENTISGMIYIGQSTDIRTRWQRHKNELKFGTHPNKSILNDYNKYGFDSFKFSIVEICSKNELNQKESIWRKSMIDSGYKMYTIKNQDAKAKIYRYTKNGEYIDSFESMGVAEKTLKIKGRIIPANQERNQMTSFGYIWLKERNDKKAKDIAKAIKDNFREKIDKTNWNTKMVEMIDGTNVIMRFDSIKDASAYLAKKFKDGRNRKAPICSCCKGNRKTAYGYKWRYFIKEEE